MTSTRMGKCQWNRNRSRLAGQCLLLACLSCGPDGGDPICRSNTAYSGNLLDTTRVLYAEREDQRVLRFFSGAVPDGSTVLIDGLPMEIDDSGNGSFTSSSIGSNEQDDSILTGSIESPTGQNEEVEFRLGSTACFVQDRHTTAAVSNDFDYAMCGNETEVYVLSSAESNLVAYQTGESVSFDKTDGIGASPFAVDIVEGLAVVSHFGTHQLSLVDICSGEIKWHDRVRDAAGALVRVDLMDTITAAPPRDVDLDGVIDTTVSDMALSHPQGVLMRDDHVFVVYINQLAPATEDAEQVLGPGVLVTLVKQDDALVFQDMTVLAFENPQAIVGHDDQLLVSASGRFGAIRDGYTPVTDGGLTIFDGLDSAAFDFSSRRERNLEDFAPAKPSVSQDHIVLGSLVSPRVLVLDRQGLTTEGEIPLHDQPRLDSVFSVSHWAGPLFFASEFSTDRVHLINALTLEKNPVPFPATGISMRTEGNMLSHGLLKIDFRESTGHALLSLSSEIVNLNPLAVFGP